MRVNDMMAPINKTEMENSDLGSLAIFSLIRDEISSFIYSRIVQALVDSESNYSKHFFLRLIRYVCQSRKSHLC